MKNYLTVIVCAVVFGAAALAAAVIAAVIAYEMVAQHPNPAPTTYQTGLYVQSDQLQRTVDSKELQ